MDSLLRMYFVGVKVMLDSLVEGNNHKNSIDCVNK